MAMTSATVVVLTCTFAVLLQTSARCSLLVTRRAISLYFAKYTVTMLAIPGEVYSSAFRMKRRVSPSKPVDFNSTIADIYYTQTFAIVSTTNGRVRGDLQHQSLNSTTQKNRVITNLNRQQAGRLSPFAHGAEEERLVSKRNDPTTMTIPNTDNTTELFQTGLSSMRAVKKTSQQILPTLATTSESPIVENLTKEVVLEKLRTSAGSSAAALLPGHNTSDDLSKRLRLSSLRILHLSEKNFRIVAPLTVTQVVPGASNGTSAERSVYAPEGIPLLLSCSDGINTGAQDLQSVWRIGKRGLRKVKFSDRISQRNGSELIFHVVKKADAGIYSCSTTINDTVLLNQFNLHVFSVADLAIGIPFVFRAIRCSRRESWAVMEQIDAILNRRFGLYRFILSQSCSTIPWYNQKPGQTYPSTLRILALMRTSVHYQTPHCDPECVMHSKLRNILADIGEVAYTVVEVGLRVGLDDDCLTESCGATYVFQPKKTASDVRLVYVCDAGHILYETSTCEPCLPGSYAPSSGPNEVCIECPVHYYQRDSGATVCIPCFNRTLTSSNVTGADGSYVCKSAVIDNSGTKDLRDALSALFLFLFIAVVGVLMSATIGYFIWCRKRGKRSRETAQDRVGATQEIKPLRPTKKRTTNKDNGIKTEEKRTTRRGSSLPSALPPHSRSFPGLTDRSPIIYRKLSDTEALGSLSSTPRQSATTQPKPIDSVSRPPSRMSGNQPSEQVVQTNEQSATVASKAGSVSRKSSKDVIQSEVTSASRQPIPDSSLWTNVREKVFDPSSEFRKTAPVAKSKSLGAGHLGRGSVSNPTVGSASAPSVSTRLTLPSPTHAEQTGQILPPITPAQSQTQTSPFLSRSQFQNPTAKILAGGTSPSSQQPRVQTQPQIPIAQSLPREQTFNSQPLPIQTQPHSPTFASIPMVQLSQTPTALIKTGTHQESQTRLPSREAQIQTPNPLSLPGAQTQPLLTRVQSQALSSLPRMEPFQVEPPSTQTRTPPGPSLFTLTSRSLERVQSLHTLPHLNPGQTHSPPAAPPSRLDRSLQAPSPLTQATSQTSMPTAIPRVQPSNFQEPLSQAQSLTPIQPSKTQQQSLTQAQSLTPNAPSSTRLQPPKK